MIQLTYPWALLALLSIPIIIILHSLRPKRRTQIISTTLLWREALREQQRGLGLQKLLRDLSLLLLLLFALAMSLGLSAPQWLTRAGERHDSVVILDTSASMQVASGLGSRFDEAKQRAAGLIDALPESGRIALMTSGRHPLLRSAFENNKETLRQQLDSLEVSDEAGQPREALSLALSLLRNRQYSRIHFITDAAFDSNVDFASPLIEYHIVGSNTDSSSDNVALTRFDFRAEIGTEERFQMLLNIRNYGNETRDVPLSVTLNRNRLLQQNFSIEPLAEQTIVLPFRGRSIGQARASIDLDDDLSADNQAFAVMEVDSGLQLLLIGPGNFYLESVLNAIANVSIAKLDEIPDSTELARLARRYDVVIFDRISPEEKLPAGNYFLIDALAPELPLRDNGSVTQPLIIGKGVSSLVQTLDLSGVRIDRGRRVMSDEETTGLQRLFWSAETELALALLQEQDHIRLVYLGFDLNQSNFPIQAAFPLFISQTLNWLHPTTSAFRTTQRVAGEPFTIPLPDLQATVVITTPSGQGLIYAADEQTQPASNDSLLFDATSKTGIYRYSVDGIERSFAVNLTDEDESDIRARALIPEALPVALTEDQATAQVALSIWPYLLWLALILLTLEWLLWCTRRGSA